MSAIDDRRTLGELVLKRPRAAALFERLRLDYCCGGQRTLERLFAVTHRELDRHMLVEEAQLFPACRAGDHRGACDARAADALLMQALHRFEIEMHRHIHEENNLLFVRLRTASR